MKGTYIKSKFENKFFIEDSTHFHTDIDIARSLNVSLDTYRNVLTETFNGTMDSSGEVYFDNEQDINDALEWIESILVIDKLRGA